MIRLQLTEDERAMVQVLRRQRDSWPSVRYLLVGVAVALLLFAAWEFYVSGWGAVPLILLVVGTLAGSHVLRNWRGPPEASLILKLVERAEGSQDA